MAYQFIPYRRNPLFTGRERSLAALHHFFTSPLPPVKIVELVGMPGVGKTEIALEYVYRMRTHYQAIIWLHAPGWEQLAQNVRRVLVEVGVNLPPRLDDGHLFERFRLWLRVSLSRFLLILDECTDFSLLNAVLDDENANAGHVLITNDRLETADEVKTVVVHPFDDEEGPLFLLRRAGLLALTLPLRSASRSNRQAAFAIYQAFGGHPLALDQAGAYLSETGRHVRDYLSRYQQDRRAFLSRRGTASASHPFSAFDTIGAMRQGSAYHAQKLLMLYVRGELDCSDPSPHLPPAVLRAVAPEPLTLVEVRNMLIRTFLLVPDERTRERWDIHLLVRTVMQEILTYEEAQERQWQQKAAVYEPLNEEGIVQILLQVQQMKQTIMTLKKNDPQGMELSRTITTTVHRLQRAVLPGGPERREAQKDEVEKRYATFAYGRDAPVSVASKQDIRRYAQELLALMEYRSPKNH